MLKRHSSIKRTYIPPTLQAFKVDHEISLVMVSNPPDNPDGIEEIDILPSQQATPVSPTIPSQESNPFGGSSPDYPE